ETDLTPVQVFKTNLMQKKQRRKLLNNICFFLCGLLVLQILKTKMEMLPLMVRSMKLIQRSLSLQSMFIQAVVLNQGNKMTRPRKRLKEKSHVESLTRNRDLSAEFEDHSNNSSNDVNAVGSIVTTDGQNSSNSTNPFSAANTTASPTHGKSSFKDAS
nr:hypothetical protein [Tanacetum cinerariifolium]